MPYIGIHYCCCEHTSNCVLGDAPKTTSGFLHDYRIGFIRELSMYGSELRSRLPRLRFVEVQLVKMFREKLDEFSQFVMLDLTVGRLTKVVTVLSEIPNRARKMIGNKLL